MKKVFAALMIAVTVLSGAFPAVQPGPSKAARAEAPTPPTPTPPESPVKPTPGAEREIQSRPTPPAPGELAPEMEKERARDAIKAVLQKHLDYWGPRYQIGALEVEVEDEWAHGVAEWQSKKKLVDGPIHVLARRDESGAWQALMPSEEGLYLQWVEKVPKILMSNTEKQALHLSIAHSKVTPSPQAVSTAYPSKAGEPEVTSPDTYSSVIPTPILSSDGNDKVVEFPDQGFSVSIPEGWSSKTGNTFGPHLPDNTVSLGKSPTSFDVTIASVTLSNDFPKDIQSFARAMLGTLFLRT
jgi:hypothetical protein